MSVDMTIDELANSVFTGRLLPVKGMRGEPSENEGYKPQSWVICVSFNDTVGP